MISLCALDVIDSPLGASGCFACSAGSFVGTSTSEWGSAAGGNWLGSELTGAASGPTEIGSPIGIWVGEATGLSTKDKALLVQHRQRKLQGHTWTINAHSAVIRDQYLHYNAREYHSSFIIRFAIAPANELERVVAKRLRSRCVKYSVLKLIRVSLKIRLSYRSIFDTPVIFCANVK